MYFSKLPDIDFNFNSQITLKATFLKQQSRQKLVAREQPSPSKKTHLELPHLLQKLCNRMQQGASQYLVSLTPEKGRPKTKDSQIMHTTPGYNENGITVLLNALIQILHKSLQEMKTLISSTNSLSSTILHKKTRKTK